MALLLHISDWHTRGQLPRLFEETVEDRPQPDVLVITGDMLEDGLDPWKRHDEVYWQQITYWQDLYGELRRLFPKIPMICVPGNHDRINYNQPFVDKNFYSYDEAKPELIELAGLKFSGFRGTNEYGFGNWICELSPEAQIWILIEIPKETQVLITHAPPWGILDYDLRTNRRGEWVKHHMGFKEIRNLHEWLPSLKAHLFGHIHEKKGLEVHHGIEYSNAATGWHWLEIDPY